MYPNGKREEDATNVSFFLRQIGLEVCSFCLQYSFPSSISAFERVASCRLSNLRRRRHRLEHDEHMPRFKRVYEPTGTRQISSGARAPHSFCSWRRQAASLLRCRVFAECVFCCFFLCFSARNLLEVADACTTAQQEHKIWEHSAERAMALRERLTELYTDSIHTDFEIMVRCTSSKWSSGLEAARDDLLLSSKTREAIFHVNCLRLIPRPLRC